MATVFKRGGRGNWLVQYFDHLGVRREKSSRTTDKRRAVQLAAKLEGDVMVRREGIVDVEAEKRLERAKLPIEKHLDGYEAMLRGKGNSTKHIEFTKRAISDICAKHSWTMLGQISASGVDEFATKLFDDKMSNRTVQAYKTAIKGFTKWLSDGGTLAADPLRGLKKPNPKLNRRRERRMLLPEEFGWLSLAAHQEPERFGMLGSERVLLYRTAIETGLRAGELRALKRGSLHLSNNAPYVLARAGTTKNGKQAHQYIRRDLADSLKAILANKPSQAPVFALPENSLMAEMLRADLAAARKAWLEMFKADPAALTKREATDFLLSANHDCEVLDFHALRHTCGAWDDKGGTSVGSFDLKM